MMQSADLGFLSLAAISTGFLHTIAGPDHYVPFVAMSKAGGWSLRKTVLVTLVCGFGHVSSSIALGFIGLTVGVVVKQLEAIESVRGDWAGWLLIAFGLGYLIWGLIISRRLHLNQQHHHHHSGHPVHAAHGHQPHTEHHLDGQVESTSHVPAVVTADKLSGRKLQWLTPWMLVVIFVLGPCEVLIPLVMYPAARGNVWGAAYVAALFSIVTLLTMLAVVLAMRAGFNALRFERLQRYSHALAGLAVLASGVAIKFGL